MRSFVIRIHFLEGDDSMKNTLTRMLLLAAALVLAMSLCLAHAEETNKVQKIFCAAHYLRRIIAKW